MNEVLPLQMVCEMARNIPCSPWLLPKVTAVVRKEDYSNTELEGLILQDTGLAATVIRIANSAFFNRGRQCETLQDAILRLGRKEVYRLVSSSLAQRWLSAEVKGYGWEPGDLYKHSAAVAIAAQAIAKGRDGFDPEMAYTAGLFHDVGKLALAYSRSDQFDTIRIYQQQSGVSWRQAEHDLLGYDHCDIGGALLEGWQFPVEYIETVCYYSRPQLAAKNERSLVTLVHAAKHLAIMIGTGVGEDGFTTELDAESLTAEGYTSEMLEKFMPEVVTELAKLTGDMK